MEFFRLVRAFAPFSLLAAATTPADAQTGEAPYPADQGILFRNDVAGTRVPPDAGPTGIALGAIVARPELRLVGGYDSNVFNRVRGRGDAYLAVEPDLRLTRDGTIALRLEGHGRFTRFAALGAQDSDEYRIGAGVARTTNPLAPMSVDVSYARAIEPRGAFGVDLPAGLPSFRRQLRIASSGAAELGAVRLRLAGSTDFLRYEVIDAPDRRIDQSFRNLTLVQVAPRIEYGLGPDLGLFAGGVLSWRRSTDAPADRRRNGQGWVALAGVQGSVTDLIVGEVAVGWRSQRFDLARFRGYDGLTYAAKVDFYPSPLISLRVTADQDVENSGIPTVAGILADHVGLVAYWEVLRELLVTASGDVTWEDYRGIDTRTTTVLFGVEAAYRASRMVTIGLKADHRRRSSDAPSTVPEYSGTRLSLSVTAAY